MLLAKTNCKRQSPYVKIEIEVTALTMENILGLEEPY